VERAGAGASPRDTTVRVIALGCGGYSFGSAVLLDGGRMLTARHLVAGATSITVALQTGEAATARVVAVDATGRDLALLQAPPLAARPGITVATLTPTPGDRIDVYGHPRGGPLTMRAARIVAFTASPPLAIDGGRVMTVDAPFDAGVSGGPVVDGAGALVGIAIGVERASGVGIAIPVDVAVTLAAGHGAPAPASCDPPR
jgi:S1-C subfamily serine protease